MTLKCDVKFKEKPTCSFKYDMRNLVNFHPTTQKSENFFSMGSSFVQSIQGLSYKETEDFSSMTLKSDAKFESTLTLWFQKCHEKLGELSLDHSKD